MSSIKRLFILTKMQAIGQFRKLNKFSFSRRIVKVLVALATVIIITIAMIGLFNILKILGADIINYHLLCFVICFLQVVSVVSCTTGLIKSLYHSNDNQILLSFPTKHYEIFISKLLVYYYNEFIRNLMFLIPFMVAFGIFQKMDFWYFVSTILFNIVLPIIPVLVGAILSFPIMITKKLLKKSNIIQAIIFLIVFVLLLIGYVRVLTIIPNPLRIIAHYGGFTNLIKRILLSVYEYSLIYKLIVDILIGRNILLNLLYVTLVILGLLCLVLIITMPVYFVLASHSREYSEKKVRKKQNRVCKNTFLTFLRKETLLNIRDFGKLTSDYIFLFIFPFIMFFTSYVYSAINYSGIGEYLVIAFTLIIALMLTTASNTSSATAITVEGTEFSLLKTAPGETRTMAWAKITFNLVFSIFIISLNMILLMFWTHISKIDLALIWIVLILVNSGHILWSFELDLMHPKLVDYAANGSLADNKNVTYSISIGFGISLLIGALSFVLLNDNYETGWVRIILIAIGFFLARLFLFSKKLKVYFMDIEF